MLLGYVASCSLQLVQTTIVCFFCMFIPEIVKLSRRKIKSWGQILEEHLGYVCLCFSQLDRDYVVLCSAAGRHWQRCLMERVYMTLLKNIFLMDIEKSLLGTARGDEEGVNELWWLRKEDFLVSEDSSAEGAVHQRRQYHAREQKCPSM